MKRLHKLRRKGSNNFWQDAVSFVTGGQSGKDTVQQIQKSAAQTAKLSERNMILLEKDLVKLDQTLSIYNVTGVLLGLASAIVIVDKAADLIQKNRLQK